MEPFHKKTSITSIFYTKRRTRMKSTIKMTIVRKIINPGLRRRLRNGRPIGAIGLTELATIAARLLVLRAVVLTAAPTAARLATRRIRGRCGIRH